MGAQRSKVETGGFTEYLYRQVGDVIKYKGMQFKCVEHINDPKHQKGLPMASNKSNGYFRVDSRGKVNQLRVFVKRDAAIDFDWGHAHGKHGIGTVHVHLYSYDKQGNVIRTKDTAVRCMNNAEMRKYGELIKKVCPTAKFR